jgi:hypothetical protein
MNIILHCIGLPLYIIGIYIIIFYIMDQNKPLLEGIILWMSAIGLFIFGHIIEGNLRAMTIVIIYKYLKSLL